MNYPTPGFDKFPGDCRFHRNCGSADPSHGLYQCRAWPLQCEASIGRSYTEHGLIAAAGVRGESAAPASEPTYWRPHTEVYPPQHLRGMFPQVRSS